MRVDAIDDLASLETAQRELLQRQLAEGDRATYGELNPATLVAYRVVDAEGERVLIAPRNAAIKPGTVAACTGWASVAFAVTLGDADLTQQPNVELHFAGGLIRSDFDA